MSIGEQCYFYLGHADDKYSLSSWRNDLDYVNANFKLCEQHQVDILVRRYTIWDSFRALRLGR